MDNNMVKDQMQKNNSNYLEMVNNRLALEMEAIRRDSTDPDVEVSLTAISNIVKYTLDMLHIAEDTMETPIHYQTNANAYIAAAQSILNNGILTPIMGCEEEWEDVTVKEDIGQQINFKFRDNDVSIIIESVQVNKRWPTIYRLNNDNDLAHRIDFVKFYNDENPEDYFLLSSSIRFIKFPYSLESVKYPVLVDENRQITEFVGKKLQYIEHDLVFRNPENPDSYIIAPKIPFSYLAQYGIDVEEEVEDFKNMISAEKLVMERNISFAEID